MKNSRPQETAAMNRLNPLMSVLLIVTVILSACGFPAPASPSVTPQADPSETQPPQRPTEPTATQAPTPTSLPEPTPTPLPRLALQPFPTAVFELPSMPEPVTLRKWRPSGE